MLYVLSERALRFAIAQYALQKAQLHVHKERRTVIDASIASSRRRRTQSALRLWARAVLALVILLAAFTLSTGGLAPGRAWVATARAALLADVDATAPLISFQGRLVDPATGLPKPDGAYPMALRLYTVAAGGSPLYTEARTVDVVRSVFSILLGEVTPLDTAIFNGQPLFLGVTVSGDPEMAPRVRLAHAPYAIYAERANSASAAAVANTVADNAITSAKIADGSVTAADIADGAGSGLDADLFDGKNSNFLPIALGFINSTGAVSAATPGVSSTWNAGSSWYEISIAGQSYFWTDYVTVVTPADTTNCDRATASVGSVGNKLLISFTTSTGTLLQCNFQFVTYKP